MDQEKVGALIRALRLEKGLTQKQLAAHLLVGAKAVSKWERGVGCPDVGLLDKLARSLEVSAEELLRGELPCNARDNGNMRNTRFFVCPVCDGVALSTGSAVMICCGRRVAALTPVKAAADEQLCAEKSDDEWYITGTHPMTKEDYVSFVAFVSGARVSVYKQYPEGPLEVHMPCRDHGRIVWYSRKKGLQYQLI